MWLTGVVRVAETSQPQPSADSSVSFPVAGHMVEADTPATYRLPNVSSSALRPRVVAEYAPPQGVLPQRPLSQNQPFSYSRSIALRPRTTQSPTFPVVAVHQKMDVSSGIHYLPTTAELTAQLLPAVQRGYGLAQRGALYAAQTEFVQVLRRVAQAKDAASGSNDHSRALAAGLRALDEAEDFVPRGLQLEADLDVWIVASSHRTPVLPAYSEELSPYAAVTLYHAYAERQLAQAVAGEQAGSMALHGLGKIDARLAERSDDDVQLVRSATTMYSAALAARGDNHLAANELAVLLCRNGRPVEAARLFERTIDLAATATAYHNLAVAQQKLGLQLQAAANERESQRLAAWERASGAVSRRAGVEWVSPADMARVAQPTPMVHAMPPAVAKKSPWQRTVELAKSLPLPSAGALKDEPLPSHGADAALPFAAPTLSNDTRRR